VVVIPRRTIEERDAHLFLQFAQRNAYGRSRAADTIRGSADASLFHHGSEHFELLKFHLLLQSWKSLRTSENLKAVIRLFWMTALTLNQGAKS
jgi:hypothetical protein